MTVLALLITLGLVLFCAGVALLNHELRITTVTKEVDDLQASQASITAAVATAAADLATQAQSIKDLAAQIAAGQTINPADVEAVAVAIQAQADALNAASTAAVPPAPAAPEAPTA